VCASGPGHLTAADGVYSRTNSDRPRVRFPSWRYPLRVTTDTPPAFGCGYVVSTMHRTLYRAGVGYLGGAGARRAGEPPRSVRRAAGDARGPARAAWFDALARCELGRDALVQRLLDVGASLSRATGVAALRTAAATDPLAELVRRFDEEGRVQTEAAREVEDLLRSR